MKVLFASLYSIPVDVSPQEASRVIIQFEIEVTQ